MKSKHSQDDYMYCADHTAKLVQEQWVYTVNHDGKWAEVEEEEGSNKVQAVSFYPRTELVEPLEWKAPENRLKPSSIEPPKLELKELPKHLEYAFLQKIRRICACIHQRPQRKENQYAISKEDQYAVLEIWNEYNILEDIKRGPYSKKSLIRRIQSLDTPYRTDFQTL
ncbi:hypothetical protein Tco_1288213 [Tanacetum coccineum]